jgi:hypothetical protein
MTVTEEGQTEKKRPDWVDDNEMALERAAEALRAAWDATRDTRVNALESAKLAAKQLAEAIDRGVETARQKWQEAQSTEEE